MAFAPYLDAVKNNYYISRVNAKTDFDILLRGSHLHFVNLLFIGCETANSSLHNPLGDVFRRLLRFPSRAIKTKRIKL